MLGLDSNRGRAISACREIIRLIVARQCLVMLLVPLLFLFLDQLLLFFHHFAFLFRGVLARQDVVEPEELALREHKVKKLAHSTCGQNLVFIFNSLIKFNKTTIDRTLKNKY